MSITPDDIRNLMARTLKTKDFPEITSLDLDIINLTVLLQSAGFELEHFDFLPKDDLFCEANKLKIQISCGYSNIMAKLNYNLLECSCPKPESSHNSSFWEVQGTAPNTPTNNKSLVRSSNLIPDFSKENAIITKIMVAGILGFFKQTFNLENNDKCSSEVFEAVTIERNIEASNCSPSFANIPNCMGVQNLNNGIFSTPLSSVNVTPTITQFSIPNIIVSSPKIQYQTPPAEGLINFDEPISLLNRSFHSNSRGSSENNGADFSDDRDTNVIQNIMEARQKLDSALIYMKLNLTQNVTPQSVTPKTPNEPKKSSGLNLNTVNRRFSLDSQREKVKAEIATNKIKPVKKMVNDKDCIKMVNDKDSIKKTMAAPIHAGVRKLTMPMKIIKNDTPRPIVPLQKPTTSTIKTIGRSVSGTNVKTSNNVILNSKSLTKISSLSKIKK